MRGLDHNGRLFLFPPLAHEAWLGNLKISLDKE